jgi:hypothetical protein
MDVVVLTYEEAATHLGIKVSSVRQRVLRKKWRTLKGNDGTVRIEIPADEIEKTQKKTPDEPSEPTLTDGEKIASLTAKVEGLERLVEAERRAYEAANERAVAERCRAEQAEQERDRLRAEQSKKSWLFWK